jgi:phosphoglycerate dehydrogenase-like enzyme
LLVPQSRSPLEVRRVLADWRALALGAEQATAAPGRLWCFSPGVGVETIELQAWAERLVPAANTAGANASVVSEWCLGASIEARQAVFSMTADASGAGRPPHPVGPERGGPSRAMAPLTVARRRGPGRRERYS